MNPKLLIVDDERGIVDMIQSYFQTQYDILTAYSGQEALKKVACKPDLILLDINMPGMDGLTVCQRIREHIACPILFLTARIESSDKIIGFQAGADDYIVKPFNLDEVAARVTVQLRNQPTVAQEPQASQKLSFKNLVLNPETFELESGEQTLRLGKKEFQIFETLLAHPKKIFTKEELYEVVWEEVYLPGDNTLNAQLSNLRKKIAQLDPDEDYIETVWGLGVRLKGDK